MLLDTIFSREDSMPVWSIPLVEAHPQATLSSWQAYEVQREAVGRATRHLVGYVLEHREGRVTSEIVEVEAGRRLVRTASGRVYKVVGAPGSEPDARYTWSRWLDIHKATVLAEVTGQLFEARAQSPT
jgi:hypothetical protein